MVIAERDGVDTLPGRKRTGKFGRNMTPRFQRFCLFPSALFALACGAPPGPTGPEKAAAYHAQEAEREDAAKNPRAPTESEMTLQFPMCSGKKAPPFPNDTSGAAFRAIVFLRIDSEGKATEHCYLAVEGEKKWEEKALGEVSSWRYETEHAGEPRERVVTYRVHASGP